MHVIGHENSGDERPSAELAAGHARRGEDNVICHYRPARTHAERHEINNALLPWKEDAWKPRRLCHRLTLAKASRVGEAAGFPWEGNAFPYKKNEYARLSPQPSSQDGDEVVQLGDAECVGGAEEDGASGCDGGEDADDPMEHTLRDAAGEKEL